MKFGISIPNNWGVENPEDVVGVAVLAEELGYDSVWTAEHMLNTGYVDERIGNRPYYHGLCTLAYVAARTTRITLGTSVVVLPFRHPMELAKFGATLDRLSGGRMILGAGVGGLVEEFDAMGISFAERGAISDETLEVVRALWTQQKATHHGTRWNFTDVKFSPKPLQPSGIPIWIGGASKAAQKRAGKLGDGWHPTGISPEEFRAGCDYVRSVARAAGRDPSGFTMCMRLNISVEGMNLTTEIERRSVLPGEDADATVSQLKAFADAGATHFLLAMNTQDIPALRDMMKRVASNVLPRLR